MGRREWIEEERAALNEQYRAEGWGRVAEAALGIAPSETESQAREVARWAHDRIAELEARLAPLVVIADAHDASELDEHRPEWGERDPATVELLAGRGGTRLLTLADCLAARRVVRS